MHGAWGRAWASDNAIDGARQQVQLQELAGTAKLRDSVLCDPLGDDHHVGAKVALQTLSRMDDRACCDVQRSSTTRLEDRLRAQPFI